MEIYVKHLKMMPNYPPKFKKVERVEHVNVVQMIKEKKYVVNVVWGVVQVVLLPDLPVNAKGEIPLYL